MGKKNFKVLLLACLSGKEDEGIRNIADQLYNHLTKKHIVIIIKPSKLSHLIEIIRFKPDVIHSLRGPSFKTLFLLKFLGIITGTKKNKLIKLLQ